MKTQVPIPFLFRRSRSLRLRVRDFSICPLFEGSIQKLILLSLALAAMCVFPVQAAQVTEIVFADSQGAVLQADVSTGAAALISSGIKLIQPFGIAVGSDEIFVSDTGCLGIVGISRATGEQRLLSCGGFLGMPFGIALERNGDILVVNGEVLMRINPNTGAQSVISPQGSAHRLFRVPLAVAVAENDDIYVADALGPVFRVSPRNGEQMLISQGGFLERPQGIAVRGNDIYVTDVATLDMNFGIGRIIRVNANTREQKVISEGNYLVAPVGIAVEQNGQLIVGDPYTINLESSDLFDGAIMRINKSTGAQELITRCSGDYVNPRGVAVVSNH